jgi:hypothetical protein
MKKKQFACTSLGYMVMGSSTPYKIASKVRGKRIMEMVLLLLLLLLLVVVMVVVVALL